MTGVFISWSGELSRRAALAFRDWLPNVLQGTTPWMSDVDIALGASWTREISEKLNEYSVGLICVTRENQGRVWLNFEAGALSKAPTIGTSRVIPILIDFESKSDLRAPLSLFQAGMADKDGMHRALQTINAARGADAIEAPRVAAAVNVWWPGLEEQLNDIRAELTAPPASAEAEVSVQPRTEGDLLGEVLELTRGLTREMATLRQAVKGKATASNVRTQSTPSGRYMQTRQRQIDLQGELEVTLRLMLEDRGIELPPFDMGFRKGSGESFVVRIEFEGDPGADGLETLNNLLLEAGGYIDRYPVRTDYDGPGQAVIVLFDQAPPF